jgi:hypothetical protein
MAQVVLPCIHRSSCSSQRALHPAPYLQRKARTNEGTAQQCSFLVHAGSVYTMAVQLKPGKPRSLRVRITK